MRALRPYHWLALLFFAYTTVVGALLPVSHEVFHRTLAANVAVLIGVVIAAQAKRHEVQVVANYLMLALMLLAYREMGWFALPHADTNLENAWVVWDRALLNDWKLRSMIELLGPVIPIILEISYTLVYAIGAASLTILYAFKQQGRVPEFLFCLLLGTFASYALFPYFPSEPPRTVFPDADLPTYKPVFRAFNYWLLGNYGIHTSVFPSAHVSSSFAAAFGLHLVLKKPRWPWRVICALATAIALSVIYGRYHFAVDAAAGFAIAVLAWQATRILYGERNGPGSGADPLTARRQSKP